MAEPVVAGSPGPYRGSYWVLPGRLLAGPYPGRPDSGETEERLLQLREAGVRHIFDLTLPGGGCWNENRYCVSC